jgi:glycosyltransferase involved in cell wall biosynthesis
LHDLRIQYDASTFDTDPFEPQPDSRGTIFPFWVSRDKASPHSSPVLRQGYVELPYTLPQDSTLFLLLRESSADIWLRKLDWIVKHGGMALLNVHPDYIHFEDGRPSRRTFPAAFYAELLEYTRSKYGDCVWHVLPQELASFVAKIKPVSRPKPRRICMLTHSFYQADARVTRYAEALAERGDHVDVVALRRSPDMTERETVGNVNLVRIQPRFGKNEQSPISYLVPLLRFLFTSTVWIARQHRRRPYDLLHIHNIPDFLVFAAAYPKLTGTRVILDIHDIVPEFYASKFSCGDRSPTVKFLKWIERLSSRVANHVIISNHLWLEKYSRRTGANGKCSVFINNVDSRIFMPRARTRADGKFIILFPGGLQWHQGLDIAIRAFKKVGVELPEGEFHIYGDGNMKDNLIALSNELGLNGKIRFFSPLPVRQIAEVMANADLGVVPKRADSFGNEAYSTKIMEFMSLGIPVVVSNTRIDRYYFDDSQVRFFESGNPDALAEAMLHLIRQPALRNKMVARASEYAASNSWERRKKDYLNLVDSLIGGSVPPGAIGAGVACAGMESLEATGLVEK